MILVADVLKAISDKKTLDIFRTVALTKPDTGILISKINLTRKQYYSRVSSLMKAGLITRKNGKHTLTAFGKIIHDIAVTTVDNAVNNYWKLKAIDLLEISKDLPTLEYAKVIDNLIQNHEMKTLLITGNKAENQSYASTLQQSQIAN